MLFNMDVIFKAFIVFILSLFFSIIPHRYLNVNVFQSMCPIWTAAECFILGVSASVVYGLIYWITTLF